MTSSSKPRQFVQRLAHLQFSAAVAVAVWICLFVTLPFLVPPARPIPDAFLAWPLALQVWYVGLSVLMALWFATQCAQAPHEARLCLLCVQGVDDDGASKADRGRVQLLLIFHHVTRSLLWVMFLTAAPGTLMLVGFFQSRLLMAVVGVLGLVVFMLVEGWAGRQHRRLWPWCVICRDDGDWGMHEKTPVPGPQMTKSG